MPSIASPTAAVLLVAALCVAAPVAAQRRDAHRKLVVRIVSDVNVSARVLDVAIAEAGRICTMAGIEAIWADTGDDIRSIGALTVRLTRAPRSGRAVSSRALGVTPVSMNGRPLHAWVFYERIRDRAAMLRMNEAILLGAVIAHELGHLMLPRGYHSNTGLMRERWDRQQAQKAMWGQLAFSSQEAESIRSSAVDLAASLPLASAR